jgi:hypothetical protein
MPKLSLKEILLCTAIVAVGVMCFVALLSSPPHSTGEYLAKAFLFWMAGPLIGVGLGLLWRFNRRWIGAVVVGVIGLVVLSL